MFKLGGSSTIHIYDSYELPYEVKLALIVENQDTFRYFPPLEGAVCVYGAGYAGAVHVGALPWLKDVPLIVCWGDMDADGLQILDVYREYGIACQSILMDKDAYLRYERFGTSQATGKQALDARRQRELLHLTQRERELYDMLCNPSFTGHRRIEQERILLDDAVSALCALREFYASSTTKPE